MGGTPPEKDPGTSSFYPSRDNYPICYHRSCLFRRVSGERERCLGTQIPLIYHLPFFHISRSSVIFPFGSSTPVSHPRTRACTSRMPQKGARSLIPLFGRPEIKLPLPGFEPTTLNSVTFWVSTWMQIDKNKPRQTNKKKIILKGYSRWGLESEGVEDRG